MPQNYTPKGSTTGTPDQLRQALGYVPARTATGGTGSGIIVTGGPSGPEISFDTSVLLAAGAFFIGGEAEDSSALVIPGPAGQAGAAGVAGPPGAPGSFGWDGADGEDGQTVPGPIGATGPTGVAGAPGSVGPPGGDGEDGSDGWSIPGPIGATGSTGATGPTGSIGPPGSDGEDGAEGLSIPGPVGPQGAAGAPGATGPMGPFLQGDEGPEGPSGFSIVGPPGAAGAAGVAGVAGSIGPPGVDGESVDHFELVGFPQVKDADLVLTDITVNDVSTSRHGFTPKAPSDATKFLDGTGAWSVPAGTGTLLYSDGSVPGGNTVANTVTETAFTSAYTLPASSVSVGDVLRITMTGLYSTALVAPNLTGKLKLGGTTVLNTGALTAVAGVTNAGWTMTAWLIVTAIGSGGTVEAQAYAEFATAATTALSANVTNTAAVSINFATTEAITSTVQWSAASASNTITLRQMVIEKITTTATVTGALVLISEVVTSGSAANVTFSSIAATWRDLRVVVRGRGDTAAVLTNIQLQFNADTAANYDTEGAQFSGTGPTSAGLQTIAGTSIFVGYLTAATAPASAADSSIVDIADYRGTTFQKVLQFKGSLKSALLTGTFYTVIGTGWWRSTAAITAIKVFLSAGNFVNGSVVSLYGCY